ncbi:MAG: LPS export ABC transporter periplasmic protein LptC [Pseudomonadota bacterium]
MPRKLANALLIFLLLVVAVVSWQWIDERDSAESVAETTVPMAENETDYTLEDFVITNVNNSNGQVYQLRGKSLAHFVNDSNSVIDSPSITMSGENRQQWTGDARIGLLSPDFSQLKLSGDVRLSHISGDNPPVNVTTDAIDIDTGARQITGPQPLNIQGQHWSFQANQMQADLDNGILTFQSGVEANYAVP